MLAPRQDQQGLDPPGWNSCSNEKQQPSAVDEFLPATNLAVRDNPDVHNDKPEDLQVPFTLKFRVCNIVWVWYNDAL